MPRVTISEPGKTPQPYRFKLEREIIKIGRGSENDIVIDCASASTHHCEMRRIEGGYILKDTGSTNGIKLDDTRMSIIDLFDGMEVLVGDVPLKFQLSKEEIEEMSDEEFTSRQKKTLPSIDEEDEAPKRRASTSSPRASHHTSRPQPIVQQPGGGAAKTMLIFILMLVAIFAGLYIRHKKETGNSLLNTLFSDKAPQEKAVGEPAGGTGETPAPAEGEAAE